ncbi:MAG: hypothetical protein KGJ57_14405 [Sphingomonadales bacterium]|nr:hypothetical protein [Sphingomonadales bacterium]MDE2170595.1 hypothetical protein [Sphingomonadales bacterium]
MIQLFHRLEGWIAWQRYELTDREWLTIGPSWRSCAFGPMEFLWPNSDFDADHSRAATHGTTVGLSLTFWITPYRGRALSRLVFLPPLQGEDMLTGQHMSIGPNLRLKPYEVLALLVSDVLMRWTCHHSVNRQCGTGWSGSCNVGAGRISRTTPLPYSWPLSDRGFDLCRTAVLFEGQRSGLNFCAASPLEVFAA